MKKLFIIMLALVATTALWAGNVITYKASAKLPETTSTSSHGIHTNAFNVAIISHTFVSGAGTITFDGDVIEIGEWAFSGCSDLTSITIPASVTKITGSAFYICKGLVSILVDAASTHFSSIDGVLFNYDKTTLITYPIGKPQTTYTIPSFVTTIGKKAFVNSKLTAVEIPHSVTTIEYDAIASCSKLTELIIPNSVTSIDKYAFRESSDKLTSIQVEQGNPKYDCRNDCNAIIETATNTLMFGCINTIIPNTVTKIGTYAFCHCPIQYITIPSSVTYIDDLAFCQCNMTEILLPSSIQYIGSQAFFSNPLTKMTCLAYTPPITDTSTPNTFSGVDKTIPVYVPEGSIPIYRIADVWKDFTNYMAYTTEKYGLCVKGEQVTFANCSDILGDGTVSYTPATRTLTLNNANITYNGTEVIGIYQDITINCIGENTVYCTNTTNGSAIGNGVGKTTITGSGTLLAKSDAMSAIYGEYDLTISDGCKVTAQSAKGSAVSLADEPLTIDGAGLIAKGNGKDATIHGCELIMKNGVAIRTAHTHNPVTHAFFDAEGYKATDDIIIGVEGTGLEQLTIDNARCTMRKMILDNQLYILRGNKIYNAAGSPIHQLTK